MTCNRLLRLAATGLAGFLFLAAVPATSVALSELKPLPGQTTETPAPVDADSPVLPDPAPLTPGAVIGLPDPSPLIDRQPDGTPATPPDDGLSENAEFLHDINLAPEPVRRLRELIVEAAASGDVERLRPLMNPGPNQTQLLLGGEDGDPIDILKGFSGDPDGIEILAILLDVLSAGFAHVDAGTPEELYVWPYFAEKPIATLSAPEKVELLRIVTAGDFADMLELGNYNFFRVGITPTGEWKFFTAGD